MREEGCGDAGLPDAYNRFTPLPGTQPRPSRVAMSGCFARHLSDGAKCNAVALSAGKTSY